MRDLEIVRGSTYVHVVRWAESPVIYKSITGITAAAPPVLTVPSHGVPDGWLVAVSSVVGMTEINARGTPPRSNEYEQATVLTSSTLSLNGVNAAGFSPYESGGVLQYNTPVNLAGYTARMKIKHRVGGTEIIELTTENGRISIDTANYKITLTISAADTEDITATHGVTDLEMVSGSGVVTKILTRKVKFKDEVTV